MAAPNPEWTETALDDLFSIVGYISDDNPRAAHAMTHHIVRRRRGACAGIALPLGSKIEALR
jgi:plasmid stabilization system protein ParE